MAKRISIQSFTHRDVLGWRVNGVFTRDRRKAELIQAAFANAPQGTSAQRMEMWSYIDEVLLADGGM